MKKQCCSIVFFLTVLNIFGQQKSSLDFGIKAGIAFSNSNIESIDSVNTFRSSGKTGIILGIFLNMPISSKIVFQPNLLYVRKGYKETTYGSGYNNPISYFEIPLNFLYTLPSTRIKYFIGGGVSPAIKLNRDVFDDQIKAVDVGVNIMGGLRTPIGFSLNLNYTHGLQNISKNKNFVSNIQNRYHGLVVGYEF